MSNFSRPPRATNRRGITLLESLFAIFVAAIGILSLAALLPVGKFLITQAEHSDRGAAVAEAAMQELINRGLVATANQVGATDMIVLDPWFLSRQPNPAAPEIMSFPYDSSATSSNYLNGGTPPLLPRWTVVPAFSTLSGQAAHREAADRVFTSHDDQIMTEVAAVGQRPQALPTTGASSVYQGDYSWLATITPALSQRFTAKTMFTVQVAVFHKREPLPPVDAQVKTPSERIVLADIFGTGVGGGSVQFRVPAGTNNDFLKLKTNQWVMLVGYEAIGTAINPYNGATIPSVTTPAGTGKNRIVARWYRIVGLAEMTPGTTTGAREATLAGPDWNTSVATFDSDDDGVGDIVYDADSGTAGVQVHAYLLSDCVTVQERTIKLDISALNGY
ncbi:MAG: hypothetical protein AB7I37_13180 [Pirellulales bacterium]